MTVFFDAAGMQRQRNSSEELKKIIQEVTDKLYKAPDEPASRTCSRHLRTYVDPDANDSETTSNSHVVYSAPNVLGMTRWGSDANSEQFAIQAAGAAGPPVSVLLLHGPLGYMVQFRGAEEDDRSQTITKGC